jgi:hypothetical protein
MTPKEKAEDLVNKFFQFKPRFKLDIDNEKEYYQAKEFALIAVDEIIKSNPIFVTSKLEGKDGMHEAYLYWKKVKEEIEKL